MPANQLLVTLADGTQVAIMAPGIGELEHVRVIVRDSPGGCWGPAVPLAKDCGGNPHERGTYHIGEW